MQQYLLLYEKRRPPNGEAEPFFIWAMHEPL